MKTAQLPHLANMGEAGASRIMMSTPSSRRTYLCFSWPVCIFDIIDMFLADQTLGDNIISIFACRTT